MRALTVLEQYFPILLFIGFGLGLGLLMVGAGSFVSPNRPDPQKLSPYECGFEAFEDARMKFDVRYYLVAILFILFDLEIAFLFPWAVVLNDIGLAGFISMMIIPREEQFLERNFQAQYSEYKATVRRWL